MVSVTNSTYVNIVLFGPSGVKKKIAGKCLGNICRRKFRCDVQFIDISDYLERSTHVLLEMPAKYQQEQVDQAIHKISCRLKPGINIIALHASHLCEGVFAFPCSPGSIQRIRPNICITLLDDIYACHARLTKDGYPYRYHQLLTWRIVECGIADNLAEVQGIENIYFAAKHPAITTYRLIFDLSCPRVYSASQITAVRDSPRLRAEIETHRRELHRQYAVFDPLTIDDRVLINAIPRCSRNKRFSIAKQSRWPSDLSDMGSQYRSLVPEDANLFPITVELKEAIELDTPLHRRSFQNVIDAQIRRRDFRYIDQADVMAAYRPRLNGHESSGVAAEKTYAAGSGARPVVEYSTATDLRRFRSGAFNTPLAGPICDNLADFYESIRREASREAEKRCRKFEKRYAVFREFADNFARSKRAN